MSCSRNIKTVGKIRQIVRPKFETQRQKTTLAPAPAMPEVVPAFWRDVLLAASIPTNGAGCESAVKPAAQYSYRQRLFGFEAQLSALSAMLSGIGQRLLFVPAPELFAAPSSYRPFERFIAPERSNVGLVHLRLGMARHARLLKGARNVMLSAEAEILPPLGPQSHPFASGQVVPSGFAEQFVYYPEQMPLRRFGNREFARAVLPAGAAMTDVREALARHPAMEPAEAAEITPKLCAARGLFGCSFAEFDAEEWRGTEPARMTAHSADWRRAFALARESGTGGMPAHPFILLAWNLGNPASMLPALVLRLCRSEHLRNSPLRVVLFPFNETWETAQAVPQLVEQVRNETLRPQILRSVFLARLSRPEALPLLPALFACGWIEGADPERFFTLARLNALRIPAMMLASPEEFRFSSTFALHQTIPPDEELRLRVSDQFGERIHLVPSLSHRALADVLLRSEEMLRQRFIPARQMHHAEMFAIHAA